MESLPPEEFQDLLRPCFQEDEMKLILTGAVLGLLAGIAQLVFVFGGACRLQSPSSLLSHATRSTPWRWVSSASPKPARRLCSTC